MLAFLPNYMKYLKPTRALISHGNKKRGLNDNIKLNLQEMESKTLCWVQLAQYRDNWQTLVNTVMNIRVV